MAVLGIDLGRKTIGLAKSDPLRIIATGIKTVYRRGNKADLKELTEIICREGIEEIVIGLPLNLDGHKGDWALEVEEFARQLEAAAGKKVITWDERWTTMAAQRMLIEEADMSRRKRKKVVDQVAATLILQTYLDYAKGQK